MSKALQDQYEIGGEYVRFVTHVEKFDEINTLRSLFDSDYEASAAFQRFLATSSNPEIAKAKTSLQKVSVDAQVAQGGKTFDFFVGNSPSHIDVMGLKKPLRVVFGQYAVLITIGEYTHAVIPGRDFENNEQMKELAVLRHGERASPFCLAPLSFPNASLSYLKENQQTVDFMTAYFVVPDVDAGEGLIAVRPDTFDEAFLSFQILPDEEAPKLPDGFDKKVRKAFMSNPY